MAIGRPISLTPNIATKNISSLATADQTEFTVTGGYRINEIAVYRNGVRLAQGRDFTASDGTTVNLVSGATESDVIEFSVFDSFNVADAIVGAASSQTVNGDLNVTGNFYSGSFNPTSLVGTAATFNSTIHVGSALTANAAGDVETIGIITAATFKGDGSGLTGIGETVNVRTETITVSGVSTFTGVSNFSAAINADATTDSTSTSTGALIVDGGLGVAKNVYIGAGLSVAGTLTYEDVTNVDSVGMVTAKSGVNVSGGELNVGLGFSVGNAGIITSTGGTIDLKNSGSVSNIKFYCESGNSHYTALQSAAHSAYSGNVTLTLPTTTDTLIGKTTTDTLTNKTLTSPTLTTPVFSGQATGELKVGSGITMAATSGVATFADGSTTSNALKFGSDGDLVIYHDGSESYIHDNGTGGINLKGSYVKGLNGSDETMFNAIANGAVELYYNDVKVFNTDANGIMVKGPEGGTANVYIYADEGDDNSDKFQLTASDGGPFIIGNRASGSVETNIECNGNGNVELYYDNSKKFETTNDGTVTTGIATATWLNGTSNLTVGSGITMGSAGVATFSGTSDVHLVDNVQLNFGNGKEGDIYRDSAQMIINNDGGNLKVRSASVHIAGLSNEKHIVSNTGVGVTLFYNNSSKLETTSSGVSVTGTISDTKGDVRQIIYQNKTSGYTLVASDAGKAIHISTGGVTINNSIFSAGDAVTIINNSGSNQTITQGSGVTLYDTGDDGSTGNKTLGPRGMATVWFASASVGYISGNFA